MAFNLYDVTGNLERNNQHHDVSFPDMFKYDCLFLPIIFKTIKTLQPQKILGITYKCTCIKKES